MKPTFCCQDSGKTYPLESLRWRGEGPDSLLDLKHSPNFDPEKVKFSKDLSLWRYKEVMALPASIQPISVGEGMTPLIHMELDGVEVKFKMDHLFPSGSYKDRGATTLISFAKSLGVEEVVQDSSGNAGAAIANYCALAGIRCRIFVPASTSPAKLTQMKAFGAELNLVEGSREDTANAARSAAKDNFYASHVWHPVFYEGTKTFAYEMAEQMDWGVPDTLILPAGNGTLLIGAYIGFGELKELGIISHVPKLIGVQAANCAPLYHAFRAEEDREKVPTLAEGIAIAEPRRGTQMMKMVRDSGGIFLAVDEGEIRESLIAMCRKGHFIEPTSAAVVAGVRQYLRQHAQKGEKVASVLTGNGLKSGEKIQKILKARV